MPYTDIVISYVSVVDLRHFQSFFYKGPSILKSMLIHNHSVGSDVIIMSQLNLGLQFYQKKKKIQKVLTITVIQISEEVLL